MASRKSGSDIHNTGPVSYLEDVSFKIGDKFRSPAKVGLPIGFCVPDCAPLLRESQYDFSLEMRTIQWAEELDQIRVAQERAKLKASGEGQQQASETGSAREDSSQTALPDPLPPAINPVMAGLRHNDILTPLPAPSLSGPRHREPSPPPQHNSGFNLADFECEEDPFDKLELKTINDKEELRSILQLQAVSPPEQPDPACEPKPLLSKHLHKPNGLVALLQLDEPGGHVSSSSLGPRGPLAAFPCNIRSLSFPKFSESEDELPPAYDNHKSYSTMDAVTRGPGLPNGTSASLLGALLHGRSNGQPPLPSFQGDPPRTQPSELAGHTHNGASTQSNSPKAPGTAEAVSVAAATPPAVPGGYCSNLLALSPSERQCVETIVSMGYSYESVIGAMQKQGQSLEQVLDYLFVHGRLCERGFEAGAVEECLEMYQCSEEKALEFLQLMSKFQEMGFEPGTIKEVLVVHNNNQEKALEDLMARAEAS